MFDGIDPMLDAAGFFTEARVGPTGDVTRRDGVVETDDMTRLVAEHAVGDVDTTIGQPIDIRGGPDRDQHGIRADRRAITQLEADARTAGRPTLDTGTEA